MDALVRSVLRVGFLTKGPYAAQELLLSVLGTKESHRDRLISYGLDGSVGDSWTDLMAE